MSKNNRLEKIIYKLVKVSLLNGRLNQKKVNQVISTLKTLSKGTAISGLNLYLGLLKRELDKHRLIIDSPVSLNKDQIDRISKIVNKRTPVFETEVNIKPELFAGFKIQIGDLVYEDSIADRISQIKRTIH